MSKKNSNYKKPAVQKPKETEVKEIKVKQYKIKSEKLLGFKKRNYYIDNKNVLLIAGGLIDEDIYNKFNDHCKKAFFE